MIYAAYFCGMLLLLMSNWGYVQTRTRPLHHPKDEFLKGTYHLFGLLSFPGVIAMFIAGFFVFAWWVPIVALAGLASVGVVLTAAILAALTGLQTKSAQGTVWVILGFPLAMIANGFWIGLALG